MNKIKIARLLAGVLLGASMALPAHADEQEMLQRIEKLSAELNAIKAELLSTRKKTEAVEQKQEVLANTMKQQEINTAVASVQTNAQTNAQKNQATNVEAGVQFGAQPSANTVISSYGEISYTRPNKASNQAETDVGRAVIGITHRFDAATKMVAEFEWEHAVTSKDDHGEAAVEQLYVEHELNDVVRAKAGLFLIPVGFLNTAHEPTAYFGVHRNFVETAIIPSTWREVGVGLSGAHDNGLAWDLGLTTGFDLGKWNPAESEGSESPLGSIHQEGQLAKSKDLSAHAALNWRGVPGLLIGASVFSGKAGHASTDFAGNDARISLWDAHIRYTPGAWDLSFLYSRGTISNTAALNQTFAGEANLVPASFFGWYGQAAYQVWKNDRYTLTPFVRYEQFNTANSFSNLTTAVPAGVTEKLWTLGASFKIGEGVVLKADWQKFKEDTNRDHFSLGVGYAF